MLSDVLAWLAVGTFAVGALVATRDRRRGRVVTAGAWVLFAIFWLQLVPHFAFVHKSYVEGILAVAAVPAALYAGKLLYDGRDSLFVLSRAIAVMGAIYLPFETIPAVTAFGLTVPAPRQVLIETVTLQVQALLDLLGQQPELVEGEAGYTNTFQYMYNGNKPLLVSVVLACTGLGSMTIFAGLIAAVRAPLRRKVRALAVALPVIYALNLARVTFIAIAFGNQQMQFFVDEVLFLFGGTDPYRVSFYLSDRVVSQLLAVVALVGITFLVVRELPELLTVIEDVLYMLTGDEYDLRETLDLPVEPVEQPEISSSD
jgi:archaeosortase A (PGF-CTERM-specific)